MRETIGYIGVGNMGGAVAMALARDHDVMVHDLSVQAVAACVEAGARAASPKQIAVACRTIFLCLPSFDHVRRTLAKDGALLSHASPGTLIVDQSTSHPLGFRELAADLAVRGIALVDAPVSGGPRGVRDGSLVVTIGGTAEQFAVASRILTTVTRNLLHTGPAGTAMTTKVANNYLAAIQAAVSMEVLAMAVHYGCDPSATVHALQLGSGGNYYVHRFLGSHVVDGQLESGATIEVMQKDVRLALEIASAAGQQLVGKDDLVVLIDQCVADYGRTAPYNALALTVSDETGMALGATVGRKVGLL
jgi:3-hydroxyisobutyrate dehydrogenase